MPAFTALNIGPQRPTPAPTVSTLSVAAETSAGASSSASPSAFIGDLPQRFSHDTSPQDAVHPGTPQNEIEVADNLPGAMHSAQPSPYRRTASVVRLTVDKLIIPREPTHVERSALPATRPGEKKRKRRFAPRTKTGCLTCRKRKKKCDEAKPTCKNCFNSHFDCAGYAPPKAGRTIRTATLLRLGEQPNRHPEASQTQTSCPNERSPAATDPRTIAQMALSQVVTEPVVQKCTPKGEMLAGRPYYQYDQELSFDRGRAERSCENFNSIAKSGLSVEEQTRFFHAILLAGDSPSISKPPSRYIPSQVIVEAPFHCDYGYNVNIGENVTIGRNCFLNDAARIYVGDNCTIGRDVRIYTEEVAIDPAYRRSHRDVRFGKGVVIDADCWIGNGVTILPGRVIGKGVTVVIGSVVAEDVPPYVVVSGNPARVLGSIAPL